MIDEQSSASGPDYASDRSAIGAGSLPRVVLEPGKIVYHLEGFRASSLVTRALTVAPLELGWEKSVCSLIS